MKKKSTLLLILSALLFTLLACGNKGTVTKFTQEQNGLKITMSVTSEEDVITRIDQESVLNVEGATKDQLSTIDDSLAATKKDFTAIKGVTYSSKKSAKTITEKIGMPTDKTTLTKLISEGLLPVEGENVNQLSLKQTKKLLEDAGWTAD